MSQDYAVWMEILHLIAEGSLPAGLALRTDLPSVTEIEQRARHDTSFARNYRYAKELQRHVYLDRILDIARAATSKTLARDTKRIAALRRDVAMMSETEIPQERPKDYSEQFEAFTYKIIHYRHTVSHEAWRAYNQKAEAIVAAEDAAREAENDAASELGQAVCRHLADGETLTAICRSPDMPDARSLRTMLWTDGAFGALYKEARMRQAQTLREHALAVGSADQTAILRKEAYRWVSAQLLGDQPAVIALEKIAKYNELRRQNARSDRVLNLVYEMIDADLRDGKIIPEDP